MPLPSYAPAGLLMPKQTLFFVTPELQRILDNLPEDEPRSRLEPFRAFILRWRREGRTYRKIRDILADECKVRVHHETLRRFVKRRAKPRKPKPELETEQALMVTTQPQPAEPAVTPRTYIKPSSEEPVHQRPSLQSFRNKPALASKPAVLQEFQYDEDKPLTIDRTIKD